MPNNWFSTRFPHLFRHWNNYLSKRMLLALGISAILHFFTLNGLNLSLPSLDINDDVVEVSLAPPVIKPDVKPPAPQPSAALPRPVKPRPAPKPEPVAATDQVPSPPASTEPEPEPAAAEEPTELGKAPYVPLEDINAKKFKPATFVETSFEGSIYGTKGESHISYKVNPDGTYSIKSETELKGFTGLFFGKLQQASDGVMTENGLRPSSYVYQYGSGDKKNRRASFDWTAGKLTMEAAGKVKTVDLPEGTQDWLSFMYQFMFVPPLDNMQLQVTDGKRLRQYDYTFEGEEDIPSEIGIIRTIHIGKSSGDTDEKTEVWLGVDYNYLPVKIRKTEKDGKVIEQLVTRISSDMFK